MANHVSALKRAKQNVKRNLRNKMVKTRMKNVIKMVRTAVDEKSEDALTTLNNAQSIIDKAAKKGIIHKNTASRKISRLSKLVSSASA